MYTHWLIQAVEHASISIVTGVSIEQNVCACERVSMRFVLRTQAWQCINDKILEGLKHAFALVLSLERNKNSYRTFYECLYVCIQRNSYFPLFLLVFLSFSLFLGAFLHGNNKRWREEYELYSFYYLVGWFFSRHRSLCTSSLVACYFVSFFSSPLALFLPLFSPRFVDKRPRKGVDYPIGRKDASNFFLQVRVLFFVLQRRIAYNILFFHDCCLHCLLLALPVLVCKSLSSRATCR